MRRRTAAFLLIVMSVVLGTVVAPHLGAAIRADSDHPAGLAVALYAERHTLRPGADLPLAIQIANEGDETIHLTLGCDPAIDVRVYGPDGGLVWQRSPDCREIAMRFELAPGHERGWEATWPGVNRDGQPVEPGRYSIYGTVHLLPEPSIVGPVVVEVVEGEEPDPTGTREHPEKTRTPAEPDPPDMPVESGAAFPVTDREGRQVRPDVAGHPELGDCQNLVVWWDESESEIWGQFVEREWRGEAFQISSAWRSSGPPKVAYNHHRRLWLVVWTSEETDAGTHHILGRYVECGGLEGDAFFITEDEHEFPPDDQPAVAAHGEHFAVVWRRGVGGGDHKIVGAQVKGHDTGQFAELTDPGAVSEPAIACEGRGDCLVAWTRGPGENTDVVGRYWFPREEYVGDRLLEIAVTERAERYPSIAWNGWHAEAGRGAYAVTWTDEGGERSSVRARTVYQGRDDRLDGYVVGEGVLVVSQAGKESDHGDVAQLGCDFVVVWSTGGDAPRHIVSRRLKYSPESRKLSSGELVVVSDEEEREDYPAVASALDPLALSVWQIEWPDGGADILGRHVRVGEPCRPSEGDRTPEEPDPTGTKEHPEKTRTPENPEPTRVPPESGEAFPITDREGRQVRPDVAGHPELGDCQNLVVWWDETGGQVWGRFVEREWRGEPFLVSGEHTVTGPAKVAYNHHRRLWLVVFASAADVGDTRIRGRYVECAGLEGAVFTIGEEIRHTGDQPAVAAHGEHFAVVWRRALDGGGHQIVGGQVKGLDTGQYAEISDDGNVSEPAIACEGRGDCLVAWTRLASDQADVVGRYWFPREEYVGDRLLEIAVGSWDERYPSIAWNGWHAEDGRGSYAVTWTRDGDEPRVLARPVFPEGDDRLDGYQLGDVVQVNPEAADGQHGDVAALGRDFVVAWSALTPSGWDIAARRLRYDPEGRSLAPDMLVPVSEAEEREDYPAVASALDPIALVAWQVEWPNGSADILGRHVAVGAAEGRVVFVGSVLSQNGGVLGGAGRLAAASTWTVHRGRVLDGTLPCLTATVLVGENAEVDWSVRVGDIVTVTADHDPTGQCALRVTAEDTSIVQRTVARVLMPGVWRRSQR